MFSLEVFDLYSELYSSFVSSFLSFAFDSFGTVAVVASSKHKLGNRTHHQLCPSALPISTTVFNNETTQKNPYKTLSQSNPKIQKNIAGHVLRLHVIANSDSDDDQKLKIKVRDSILSELQTGLSGISSAAQAKQYVSSKFENIKQSADYTIHENGYSYSAKVFIQIGRASCRERV